MYSYTVPHYCSSCNLFQAILWSSKGAYWSMNMCSKSGSVASASSCTSRQSIQRYALPPIKKTLYWHACMMSLPVYGIRIAIKYCLRADSHALAYVVAPVNGFGSASFMDITTCVVWNSYSGIWDGPGTSYCYVASVASVSRCIMAASCIRTLLGVIFSKKTNK